MAGPSPQPGDTAEVVPDKRAGLLGCVPKLWGTSIRRGSPLLTNQIFWSLFRETQKRHGYGGSARPVIPRGVLRVGALGHL